MKSAALAKHHTWILFGVALLFLFIAFLVMFFMASGTIKAKEEEIKKQKDELGKPANSKGEIDLLQSQKVILETQRGSLWLDNFQRQDEAKLFDWPPTKDVNLRKLGSNKELKFGDELISNFGELEPGKILKSFESGYNRLARDVAPTRFAGGSWQTALRHVTDWGNKAAVEVPWLWLALEDYWVQKAVLQPIREFHEQASTFVDVTPKEEMNPLKRTLRNRTWELSLEVTDPDGKATIGGTLRNLTDRLQTLGVEKYMTVRIWFKSKTNEEADFELIIRGEQVIGSGSMVVKSQPITNVAEINKFHKVQQVFDEATVPVRLITAVEMGMLDHKNRTAPLEMPEHIAKITADAPAVETTTTGSSLGEGMGSSGGPPKGIMPGGPPGMGGLMGTATPASTKSGSWTAVLQANKTRYVKRTTDVRRMPVAISLVVENECVNEVLVAYANSPLRFQITQTLWQRYRGTLPGIPSDSASDVVTNAGTNPPFGGIPSFPPPGGAGGFPRPGGSGGKPGGGDDDDTPAPGTMTRPGGPPGFTGSTFPPSGIPGGPSGIGGLTTTGTAPGLKQLPSEANAGLSEVAIYGVMSLYEKAAKKPEEKPAEPMTTEPAPAPTEPEAKEPAPMKPAGDEKPMAPKPQAPPIPGVPPPTPNEPKK